jgi:hypothetical protein
MADAKPFTKTTAFPPDAKQWFIYEDMRGKHWAVKPKPGVGLDSLSNPPIWQAWPMPDAVAAYDWPLARMFNAATDAEMLIDGIEERIEDARQAGETPGQHFGAIAKPSSFPWWLVLLGAAAYYHSKTKRRR